MLVGHCKLLLTPPKAINYSESQDTTNLVSSLWSNTSLNQRNSCFEHITRTIHYKEYDVIETYFFGKSILMTIQESFIKRIPNQPPHDLLVEILRLETKHISAFLLNKNNSFFELMLQGFNFKYPFQNFIKLSIQEMRWNFQKCH